MASIRELLFSLVLIAVALSATLFFKRSSVTENLKPSSIPAPKLHAWVYLTLGINCVFAILCKGAGRGVLNIAILQYGTPVLTWYTIGGLLGCALYIAGYAFSKKSIYIAWNITFGSMIMGLLLNAFSNMSSGFVSLFAVLVGVSSTMGMINIYYILGVIGKKYNSMHYIRFSILFIGICGGVGGVVLGNIITSSNSFDFSFAVSVFTSALFLLFLIFSPSLAPVYYEDEWAKDSEKTEVDNERLYMFKKYKLSVRKTEVCRLLLQGYTMRQISGILSLKYPTVNTYCTSTYRKLGINSRTELLVMFRDYAAKELPAGK
jgi:DNA-binding CsgD family transcriptional regulator